MSYLRVMSRQWESNINRSLVGWIHGIRKKGWWPKGSFASFFIHFSPTSPLSEEKHNIITHHHVQIVEKRKTRFLWHVQLLEWKVSLINSEKEINNKQQKPLKTKNFFSCCCSLFSSTTRAHSSLKLLN